MNETLVGKNPFALGVIILAAGRSTRMGSPKMLLPWGKTSVLGHLLVRWQNLGVSQVAVVCAVDDPGIQAELDRANFPATNRIFNPNPEEGMFSSIRCAARWTHWQQELTHWAVVLGDQPHLSAESLSACLGFSRQHPDSICQPHYAGHRSHPVILPEKAFRQLQTTSVSNLKEFLESTPVGAVSFELNDPALALDLDRPEDYRLALAKFGPK